MNCEETDQLCQWVVSVGQPQGSDPVQMTSESAARQLIADSRANYFSGLLPPEKKESERKPSYVGLSHSINGYTPYAPYNGKVKKISPPLRIPLSPPKTLDSVSLVLNQDSYQKSLGEFESVMRDLSSTSVTMGRPERGTDFTDHSRMGSDERTLLINSHNSRDNYFPKTHSRQLIGEGDGAKVEIVTKFHSDGDHSPTYRSPGGSKQNLVQKQIERLYGDSSIAQVRMTSPEPRDSPERSNGSASDNDSGSDGGGCTKVDKKNSSGFFAKRFGITKMKDHGSPRLIDTNTTDNTTMEFKPLKVPAVFRLLRPEFREQLKQSSCKVEIPLSEEQRRERIIPIKREGDIEQKSVSNGGNFENGTSRISNGTERIVPITVVERNSSVSNQTKILNGINNNMNKMSLGDESERVVPIKRENGDISTTPKRPTGLAPRVNGFSPAQQANILGLRNGSTPKAEAKKPDPSTSSKQTVVRKLSPLSPKHIVVPTSSEKPAPMPKPEHLKSPPMSPTPGSPSSTPVAQQRSSLSKEKEREIISQTPSPVPPEAESPSEKEDVKVNTINSNGNSSEANGHATDDQKDIPSDTTKERDIIDTSPVADNVKTAELLDESYEEYERTGDDFESPEQVYLRMQQEARQEDTDYYYDQTQGNQICGLRERELLCPIMEEDNESTASGSVSNLAFSAGHGAQHSVIGNGPNGYSPDDPLLISEQGEIQDGHYFIKVLENEIFKFEEQICDFEEDLNSGQILPDESRDNVLTVIGMAKLLMAQKLTQFRGLCDKNINVSREEDPFVPTGQDLAGFWDMVHIQVEQIHTRFQGLKELKKNGWAVKSPEAKNNKTNKSKKNVGLNKPIKPKEKSEAAKKRDEARKKMLEDRKRAMKEKSQKKEEESDLIIMM